MLNMTTLKLNEISKERTLFKRNIAKREKIVLKKADVEGLIKQRRELERAKKELKITDEIRFKKKEDLTSKEKDIVYNEYVINSAIAGLNDIIAGNYEEFYTGMQNIREEIEKELKMMHN